MPGTRLEISIEARDNASATLDSVRSKLQLFDQYGRTVSDLTSKTDGFTRATESHTASMAPSGAVPPRRVAYSCMYGRAPIRRFTSA